jgi:Ala-tRNA(Pro) deacylase
LRSLTFASAEELMEIMKLYPGAVSPLGLLNDDEHKVKFFLYEAFGTGLIGVHPNDNTATIWLQTVDLVRIIKEHGNVVELVNVG